MAKRVFLKDYNWSEIQKFYDAGNSYRDVSVTFGMNHSTISRASKQNLFIPRTIADGQKATFHKYDRQYTDEHRQIMSDHAKRRGLGGTRNSSKFKYVCVDGVTVTLDSSYEVQVAKDLDANGVRWQRPGKFKWVDASGKDHKYTPDFHLIDFDVYLDPKHKGLIPLHADKIQRVIEQNEIKLFVLTVDQLSWSSIKTLIDL